MGSGQAAELGLFIGGYLAVWRSVKVIEKSEEQDEDGTLTIRERERFSNVLIIVYVRQGSAIEMKSVS